jgi:hypothetical protein
MNEQDPVWAPPDTEPPAPRRSMRYYGVPGTPAPGWPPPHPTPPPAAMRTTSGLFPSGPPRPIYREPLPVRPGSVSLGIVAGLFWMMLFGLLASNARGYVWLTIGSGVLAWLVALLLGRLGDRGAAVGVAVAAATGIAVAVLVIIIRAAGGQWLLW